MNTAANDGGLTVEEFDELATMAFQIADSMTRAVIEAKGSHTPGGWFDGTAARFQDRGDVGAAMRYLELRFKDTESGLAPEYVLERKDSDPKLFKFASVQ